MSYFESIKVSYDDTFNIDAFGRLRVSQISSQFDGKQIHDGLDLFYDKEVIGSGLITHVKNDSESVLTTSATNDVAIMQTKQRFNYSTGKSVIGLQTFRGFNLETNITKRVGYFNSSTVTPFSVNFDGFFLESSNTNIKFVINKNGTPLSINQNSWNLDKVDGTGESGVDLDLENKTGNLLFWWQFEWLGVGAVTFGFVCNNAFIPCHREDFIPRSSVYMQSPNHSLRAEIRQDGVGSGTFNYICSSFNIEGGVDKLGKVMSSNLGTNHVNANSTSNKYALLGIRLNSNNVDTLVDVLDYSILTTTSDNQLIEVWLNPTVAGTFTYNSITNSSVQIAKGAVGGTNTVTGGTLLYSDYVSSQETFLFDFVNAIRLGMSIDGTLDEIVLTCNPLTSNSDVLASINWRELS